MSALVLNKAQLVCLYRAINVYLVVLTTDRINVDVGVPWWNWTAINGPVLAKPGLANRHLVSCPLLTDVQPDIDRFGDVSTR